MATRHTAFALLMSLASLAPSLQAQAPGRVRTQAKIVAGNWGFTGDQQAGDEFGSALAAMGDLDRNGVVDLAVGAMRTSTNRDEQGAVWILLLEPDGRVGSQLKIHEHTLRPGQDLEEGDHFGAGVAALGDLNGDGRIELAVGAPGTDIRADGDQGAVWILSVGRLGHVQVLSRITRDEGGFTGIIRERDRLGVDVACLGDLDGDSVVDLAVGARYGDTDVAGTGAVWILFLNADGTVRSHQLIGTVQSGFVGDLDQGDSFGRGLAAVGDLDGDEVPDLVVGASGDDDRPGSGGLDFGAIWILLLNSDGTVKDHQKISRVEGAFTGAFGVRAHFGSAVAGAGDLDGNGMKDLVVGAPGEGGGYPSPGSAWVLFLEPDLSAPSHTMIGPSVGGFAGDRPGDFGRAVTVLEDFDGNGLVELVVAAPLDFELGSSAGAAWLLFQGDPARDGTVNAGSGPVTPVLSANGGYLDLRFANRTLELALDAPPAGPDPARYLLWTWSVPCNGTLAGFLS